MRTPSNRWRPHRVLATLIDAFVFLSPAGVAWAAIWLASQSLPAIGTLWRLTVLMALATATAWLSGRVVRRLLPLTSLLRLTMVFPDHAPSRFRVARSAGHPEKLARRLTSGDTSEAVAAEQILGMVAALSAHDRKTRGHAERVRAYTDLLTEELGLDEHARDRLRWAALLHDIGKLHVAVAILNKPGKPDAAEWAQLKAHPEIGAQLAAPLLDWLGEWGQAIVEHHERFDGTGYPHGLAGTDISRAGRIVSVVDAFETMTAARSYKKTMSRHDAYAELTRCAGSQFDPAIVHAFLRISLSRQAWAMGPMAFFGEMPFLRLAQYGGRAAVETAKIAPVAAGAAAIVAVSPLGPVTAMASSATAPSTAATTSQSARVAAGADGGSSGTAGTTAPQSGSAAGGAAAGSVAAIGSTRAVTGGSPKSQSATSTATGGGSSDPSSSDGGNAPSGSTTSTGTAPAAPPAQTTLSKNQNGADLHGRDLSGLDLHGYNFNHANLRGADLHGANLEGATFSNADLRDADLSDADATNANFNGANVYGANFAGTNLTGANLGAAPTTNNDTATTTVGQAVQVNVLGNDVDQDCPLDPSTLTITSKTKHGTVVVNADHTVTFTPKSGFTGTDQFTYEVANTFGTTSKATVKITVS